MTEQHEQSLYELIEADPRGAAELALAASSNRLGQLFDLACDARPDITPSYLAEVMGVDEDRVLSLIEGDERLSFEAFNRYASILGYRLVLNLEPTKADVPELPIQFHWTAGGATDHFRQRAVGADGVSELKLAVTTDGPLPNAELEAPEYIGTTYARGAFDVDHNRGKVMAGLRRTVVKSEWPGVLQDV